MHTIGFLLFGGLAAVGLWMRAEPMMEDDVMIGGWFFAGGIIGCCLLIVSIVEGRKR